MKEANDCWTLGGRLLAVPLCSLVYAILPMPSCSVWLHFAAACVLCSERSFHALVQLFNTDGFYPRLQAGVSADSLSHEDYLNAPGESVSSKFTTPGEYSYYCEPHQGAGMAGKIIVQ